MMGQMAFLSGASGAASAANSSSANPQGMGDETTGDGMGFDALIFAKAAIVGDGAAEQAAQAAPQQGSFEDVSKILQMLRAAQNEMETANIGDQNVDRAGLPPAALANAMETAAPAAAAAPYMALHRETSAAGFPIFSASAEAQAQASAPLLNLPRMPAVPAPLMPLKAQPMELMDDVIMPEITAPDEAHGDGLHDDALVSDALMGDEAMSASLLERSPIEIATNIAQTTPTPPATTAHIWAVTQQSAAPVADEMGGLNEGDAAADRSAHSAPLLGDSQRRPQLAAAATVATASTAAASATAVLARYSAAAAPSAPNRPNASLPSPAIATTAATATAVSPTLSAEITASAAPTNSAVSSAASLDAQPQLPMLLSSAASASAPLVQQAKEVVMDVSEHLLDMRHDDLWIDQLAKDIAATKSPDGHIRFRLMPAHLGRIDVAMLQNDQGVSVRVDAENESAASLVAASQVRLVEELRQQGVRVNHTEVTYTPNEAGRHAGQEQERGQNPAHMPFFESAAEFSPDGKNDQKDGAEPKGRYA